MRVIDADALIEDIVRLPNAGIHWYVNAEAVFKTIDEQPTIDAVPVVRCWNCRYRDDAPVDTAAPDFYFCKELRTSVRTGDFCNHGRRKDG